MQLKQITFFLIFLIVIPVSLAHAHKVIIFAWVEDGMVFSESSFGSKREAKNCKVTVVNEKGDQVYTGITDKNGKFSFKIAENIDSDLTLNLDAGQDHKANWKIPVDELKLVPSKDDIKKTMKIKQQLKKKPSIYKLLSGIGIIFLLAFVLKIFKKQRVDND